MLEWRWDIGSTKLMKFLQKANILSMTDMILFAHNEDMEYAQLILTDLLETEYILLADLLKNYNCNDSISLLVCDIVSEGFKRMCRDIVESPLVLKEDYLCAVKAHLLGTINRLAKENLFKKNFLSLCFLGLQLQMRMWNRRD